jgi:hypothetical protein
MAIQKDKVLPNGSEGNYWRIISISLDREALVATGRIALFKDKATSDAGLPHLGMIKTFSFNFTVAGLKAAPDVISYIYTNILAKANVMRSVDLQGNSITPVPNDSDINDGTLV